MESFRRFGSDWYQKWIDLTVRRMDNWGINTIGNWSDPNLGESQRKAYVATLKDGELKTGRWGCLMFMPLVMLQWLIQQLHCNVLRKKMILISSDISLATNHPGRAGSQIW